jgi:predicted DNA-binding antitoxin AbrB/MazE fold protein
MKNIHAIYENGVFRPIELVELPEASNVVFEPKLVEPDPLAPSLDEVYALLSRRFDSGEHDVAAMQDEHNP